MILKYAARGLAFAAYTAGCSVMAMFSIAAAPRRFFSVARAWGRGSISIADMKLSVEGLEHIDPARAYLVMSTHTSHFDTPALYATLPMPVRFVAKKELTYIPIFGWALVAGAAIVIDRRNRKKAMASIDRAAKTLRSGTSVLMFPEGTRTPEGQLGELKKGPFHLAVGTKAPILPVAVIGTGRVLPVGDWRIRPSLVTLRMGRPIDISDLGDDEAAREEVARRVENALRSLLAAPVPLDRRDGDA
ncbi:MAG: 1-acyl-sn-glycerol-3-phosphate acyltransferase [Deltaproteobacteria bacterium]|nr:1-acyl-sn-glycerol-3-phosphate acyltransferase [Deltaproteobacteria bacterium]